VPCTLTPAGGWGGSEFVMASAERGRRRGSRGGRHGRRRRRRPSSGLRGGEEVEEREGEGFRTDGDFQGLVRGKDGARMTAAIGRCGETNG
jgi:hypothetical protein